MIKPLRVVPPRALCTGGRTGHECIRSLRGHHAACLISSKYGCLSDVNHDGERGWLSLNSSCALI